MFALRLFGEFIVGVLGYLVLGWTLVWTLSPTSVNSNGNTIARMLLLCSAIGSAGTVAAFRKDYWLDRLDEMHDVGQQEPQQLALPPASEAPQKTESDRPDPGVTTEALATAVHERLRPEFNQVRDSQKHVVNLCDQLLQSASRQGTVQPPPSRLETEGQIVEDPWTKGEPRKIDESGSLVR